MNKRKLNVASLMINLTVVIITLYSVAHNFRTDVVRETQTVNGATLTDFTGLQSFRYFTTLSNAFSAIAAGIMLIFNVKNVIGDDYAFPKWALIVKYVATCAVALTFTTVALFLSPMAAFYGENYFTMFRGNGFFLHFLIPALSVTDFIFFEKKPALRFKYTLYALLPTVVYAAVYGVMVAGLKAWPDFYSFSPKGNGALLPVIALLMCGLSFMVSAFVFLLRKKAGLKPLK